MRILVNPAVLGPIGGVEQSTLQVARDLNRRGHDICALYNTPGSNADEWQAVAAELRQVPSFACTTRTFVSDLIRLPPAVRAARAMRPDVVWLNRAEQIVWGVAAARAARVPLVVHLRTHLPFPGVRFGGRLPAHYIAVSGYVREHWIRSGVPEDRITVVHNGIDLDEYPFGGEDRTAAARARLGLPAAGFVALYYGRISPGKGVDTLLAAWRAGGPHGPDDRLLIVGSPGDAQEEAYAAELRAIAPESVVWLPLQHDVIPVLHAADVVVLPAHWQEPFGRVVIEAMSTGRPVIGTSVGGIPEILTGEFGQFLARPEDSGAIADRIRLLRDWRDRDPGLGTRARQHVERRFSLQRTADGVESILLRAAGRPAGAGLHPIGGLR
jgi:glycosyltransferase involved in cell wall biosynthesis